MINSIDQRFFIENIRNGYDERKARHDNMGDKPITMAVEMYNLIMGSSQIVHNRGRALAYIGNGDKKRKERPQNQRHQFSLKVNEPSPGRTLGNPFMKRGGAMIKPNEYNEKDSMMIPQQSKRLRPNPADMVQSQPDSQPADTQ